MKSENILLLLKLEFENPEMTTDDFLSTVVHFAKTYHKERSKPEKELINYTLIKESDGLKFYIHSDEDAIKIVNSDDELVAEITAHNEFNNVTLNLN
jgi:hypothetical protein